MRSFVVGSLKGLCIITAGVVVVLLLELGAMAMRGNPHATLTVVCVAVVAFCGVIQWLSDRVGRRNE